MPHKINKKIEKELLGMVEIDQAMRRSGDFDQSVDKKNTKRLKQIIKEFGWPTKSLVGEEASRGAWLLAQHADHDPGFQKRCLELMNENRNQVHAPDIAYLTDRILVHDGKYQLYGTQFYLNKKTKKLTPRPIRQRSHLAKRRKSVGLEPLSEYRKRLESYYKNNPKD